MKTVKTKIGDAEVLIQTVDADITDDYGSRQTEKTGVINIPHDSFNKAKSTIFHIAEEIEKDMKKLEIAPVSLELELAMSLSANADFWIIGCESNSVIKVKIKWGTN